MKKSLSLHKGLSVSAPVSHPPRGEPAIQSPSIGENLAGVHTNSAAPVRTDTLFSLQRDTFYLTLSASRLCAGFTKHCVRLLPCSIVV